MEQGSREQGGWGGMDGMDGGGTLLTLLTGLTMGGGLGELGFAEGAEEGGEE